MAEKKETLSFFQTVPQMALLCLSGIPTEHQRARHLEVVKAIDSVILTDRRKASYLEMLREPR